jgi:hypothetical protein
MTPRRDPRSSGNEDAAEAGDAEVAERKERVLHTRVPRSLDRQLRRRARNLGLSVSTVVRHVLLNTFGLVEDIVTDSTNVALSMAGEDAEPEAAARALRRSAREEDAGDETGIVGWQEAVLNLNAVCERCNAVLRKGARGAIGVRERPGRPSILCRACLRKLEGERDSRPRGRGRSRR